MKDSKKMSETCKKVYLEELQHFVDTLEDYYYSDNKDELPLLMVLPHQYGVAITRILPDSLRKQADEGKVEVSDIAGPLATAIAEILEISSSNKVFRGSELRTQKLKESIAYEVLTVLLAQVLANGRADDFLDLADGEGMKRAIGLVEDTDDEDDDEDEDEDEDENKNCCDVCMHTKDGIRGYSLDLNKLSLKGLVELTELLSRDDKDDFDETAALFEKFMQKHGAKLVPASECKELKDKIMDRDKKHIHTIKRGKK